jgi:diacylglycerol kinase family enzyme
VLTGAHLRDAAVLKARGTSISVTPETDVPLQLDGEYAGMQPGGTAMQFDVRPAALSVFAAV